MTDRQFDIRNAGLRNETVRDVMAATRCAGFVFRRVCCIPVPASSMDRVAGMEAVDTTESDTEVASDLLVSLRHARVLDVGPRVLSKM